MSNLNWKPASRPGRECLRGRTVTLEPLEPSRHAPALWEALQGQDGLWTWMAQGPYHSAEEMIAGQEQWQQSNHAVMFAIVPHPTGAAAEAEGSAGGWASFIRIKPQHGVIEVGNVMFSPALQRTVAATEAMYLMARHVFEVLGYRRYEWKCDSNNLASRRAAGRLGFTFEGIFRQHMVVKDRNRDTAWFAMLDHEWPSRKLAFETWLDPANFDESGRQRVSLETLRTSVGSQER